MNEISIPSENNLSWGKVVTKNSLENISLPKDMIQSFINSINTIYKSVLIVFTPRNNILKIDVFPVENEDILKLQLELTQFSGDAVKQIGKIIRELNIPKNLFTSGVCVKSNLCLYEAYIEEQKLPVSITEMKERFSHVENVIRVNITKLNT